jgi:hypothetical protein
MNEWWHFERYGKKGAMGRLDGTIDALHLLAIKTPKSVTRDTLAECIELHQCLIMIVWSHILTRTLSSCHFRSAVPVPPDPLPAEEEKPKLVIGPAPGAPRTPKAAARGTEIETLLARSGSRRRIGDGEEDDETESAAARARRSQEEDVFDDRPLVQLNPVTRTPGELQMQQEEQVYGRTNVRMNEPNESTSYFGATSYFCCCLHVCPSHRFTSSSKLLLPIPMSAILSMKDFSILIVQMFHCGIWISS